MDEFAIMMMEEYDGVKFKSAKMLWDLLKNDASIDDLVNKLLSEYEIDEETARIDTLEFIDSLKKNNILE